ncbi:MAG: hypothetical protein WBP85_15690 [Terracidiphilus sp.]
MQLVQDSVPADSPALTFLRADKLKPNWWLISTLFGTAIYLYLRLFTLHNIPFLLSGDQDYFWMNGMRLLAGDHIYQDYFRYTPPGTDLVYAAIFSVFGTHVWTTNVTVLALGIAFAWVCFSLSAKLMRRSLACLTTAVFIVLVYGKAINGTNHWFAVLAISAAVNLLATGASRARLTAAGTLLALAAFFNQVHGGVALVAVCLFLLCKRFGAKDNSGHVAQDLGVLFLGFGIPLMLFNSYFIAQVGWQKVWYCQVIYVLRYPGHLSDSWLLDLGKSLTRSDFFKTAPYLPMYILLPAAYCMAVWLCCFRKTRSFPRERVALLALTGFLLMVEVATAINWLRLYAVSLPGIILSVWILSEWLRIKSFAYTLVSVLVLGCGVQQVISIHAVNSAEGKLPGGMLATTPESYEKLHWIAQRTHPGEDFFQAGWPGVYLPLQLRNPLYVSSVARFDIPHDEDIPLTVRQLQSKAVHYILWTELLDRDCHPDRPCIDSISPVRDYLHSSYKCVQTFPDGDTLWQRDE